MTLLGGQIIFGTPVFGVTQATISINLGTLSQLNLLPGHFGSNPIHHLLRLLTLSVHQTAML